MTDKTFIEQLATYRLERDLTFEQLSAEMGKAGYAIRARSLHLMLTHRLRTEPHDRTLYKVRRFLEHVRPTKRRARSEGSAA
jgi:hypothetical protein